MIASLALFAAVQNSHNVLTREEVREGWVLLFDGKSLDGWHNYKAEGVREGWQVVDGEIRCVNPRRAGDIVTNGEYDWFELKLDFKLAEGSNSGICFRVSDQGQTMWQSGPEVQLYDHPVEDGVETTGFLYQLYSSKTDAQKSGEWNTMRIVLAPDKSATYVNGVKYYEYVYGSEDFWSRVAESKFSQYPYFARAAKGKIGLQGDHGMVSFRNIKIRPISPRSSDEARPEQFRWRGIGG